MSVFHGLSGGKIAHAPETGVGVAVGATAVAVRVGVDVRVAVAVDDTGAVAVRVGVRVAVAEGGCVGRFVGLRASAPAGATSGMTRASASTPGTETSVFDFMSASPRRVEAISVPDRPSARLRGKHCGRRGA